MKDQLFAWIDSQRETLLELADRICDNPELGLEEYKACAWLCQYLEEQGFAVEKSVGGLETAFRAEYVAGTGEGPAIGLLCEYDALEGIGHGCGHHLQGPCILGAASALKHVLGDQENYRIIVYGTPAEETAGGKITMLENGCFQDIDLALMMHASGSSSGTSVDTRTLAMSAFRVTFRGVGAHAAIAPHKGRSALDALLLAFQGVEFLREHVPDDVRMHYAIPEATGPSNAVHARAVGSFGLRSYSRTVLDEVIQRFKRVLQGAALMTDTTFELLEEASYDNGIPVDSLREVLMENARLTGAPNIRPPREKAGSTDFGNVTHRIPGACIRVSSDGGREVPGHTKEAAALGKSDENHAALIYGAKILAAAVYDLVAHSELMKNIKDEFAQKSQG